MSNPTQSVRIVIADHHSISRDGLRRLLETDPELLIVGETGDDSEAVTLIAEGRADVLLLDFPPCSQSTLKTLQQIAASGSSVRTIILTETFNGPDVTDAIQLGARGVVFKDSTPEVLFKSIHSVMAGHYWIDCGQVTDALASLRKLDVERRRRKAFGLTRTELEIVGRVVAGRTNKEIAQEFSISENTVKSHLTHIFNKLGASSRVELALFAMHHRLLDGV